jgi:dolichol-phosphate mannosyltransferase
MKTIIIPTLNEEENIGRLIRLIFQYLGSNDVRIIVVDDNSTDGTHYVVRGLQEEFNGIKLIIRTEKRGLSSAVQDGARQAPDGPIVVMDADLSHDPKYLKPMFEQLSKGYDVVVGSRNVPGGGVVGWSGSRIAMSKIATLIGRLLLRIRVRDPMSGFVGVKSRDTLIHGFSDADFKFLIETLARNRDLQTVEVPIVFRDRTYGESKLGAKTILLYLALVFKLALNQPETGSLRVRAIHLNAPLQSSA